MSRHIYQKESILVSVGPWSAGVAVTAGVSPISIYLDQAHHLNCPAMSLHPGRARAARICVNLRHYRFLQSVPAPVFSFGTALALKSGNSSTDEVNVIPAVPFFDLSTHTIYAAVIRPVQAYGNSGEKDGLYGQAETFAPRPGFICFKTTAAQLIADAVSPHVSIRTHSHNSQESETASVFLSPDTNPAAAAGPDGKNPNLNKTNGDQRANCHVLFTEGRDAGDTSLHPVITTGTAANGSAVAYSGYRADLIAPRGRRSRLSVLPGPTSQPGAALERMNHRIREGSWRNTPGTKAAPIFRPHQPNYLNNPTRCVGYAAGALRTGGARVRSEKFSGALARRPFLFSFTTEIHLVSVIKIPAGAFGHKISHVVRRQHGLCRTASVFCDHYRGPHGGARTGSGSVPGLYDEGLLASQVFGSISQMVVPSVGRAFRKRPAPQKVFLSLQQMET